jgi:hypothetical protein
LLYCPRVCVQLTCTNGATSDSTVPSACSAAGTHDSLCCKICRVSSQWAAGCNQRVTLRQRPVQLQVHQALLAAHKHTQDSVIELACTHVLSVSTRIHSSLDSELTQQCTVYQQLLQMQSSLVLGSDNPTPRRCEVLWLAAPSSHQFRACSS